MLRVPSVVGSSKASLLQRARRLSAGVLEGSTATATAESTSASPTSVLRIVSRRAWNARPVTPKSGTSSSSTPPGTDEKPWPKSVIIGRNVAMSLLIPYTMAWFLSIHAPSRKAVDSIFPGLEQRLRSYFGKVQHDGIAYPDVVAGVPLEYQLDDEPPLRERTQQANIQQLIHTEIPVTMTLATNGGTVTKTVVLPGTVPVTPDALVAAATATTTTTTTRVAVDFEDIDPAIPTSADGTLTMDESSLSMTGINSNSNHQPITQQHHTYSSWFYQAPAPPASSSSTTAPRSSTMSNMELEISRLEYTVATLEAELNNTSSTRNMDDMRQELAETKSQLRSARWKRRFGVGQ